jgi:hypothetical protein
MREIDKIVAMAEQYGPEYALEEACATPGAKIRSGGKGRGMAKGKGKGPIGAPVGEKDDKDDDDDDKEAMKQAKEMAAKIKDEKKRKAAEQKFYTEICRKKEMASKKGKKNESLNTIADIKRAIRHWDYSRAVADPWGGAIAHGTRPPRGFPHKVESDIWFDDDWENFIIRDGNTGEWTEFSADVLE